MYINNYNLIVVADAFIITNYEICLEEIVQITEYSEAHFINWEDNFTQMLAKPASMAIFSNNIITFTNATIFTTIIILYS